MSVAVRRKNSMFRCLGHVAFLYWKKIGLELMFDKK